MDWVEPAALEVHDATRHRSTSALADDLRRRIKEVAEVATSDRLVTGIWRPRSDLCVTSIAGEMSAENARQLTSMIEREVSGPICLIIDLSALTFIDSTGITTLLRIANRITERGGTMLLAAPIAPVALVFDDIGLNEQIVIAGSLEVALWTQQPLSFPDPQPPAPTRLRAVPAKNASGAEPMAAAPTPHLARMFEIVKPNEIVPVTDSLEAALQPNSPEGSTPATKGETKTGLREEPMPENQRHPTHEEIARRAYEISQSDESGTDEENWHRAERELTGRSDDLPDTLRSQLPQTEGETTEDESVTR